MWVLDVVAVGAANVDLIAQVNRLPGPDEEVSARSVRVLPGGSAANVATGVRRLGCTAGCVALVGTDYYGDLIFKEFEKDGVDASYVTRVEGNTGIVFAAVDPKGQRVLYAMPGAGLSFSLDHVPLEYVRASRYVHLSSLSARNILGVFEPVAKMAKRNGVRVVFDPGSILASEGLANLAGLLAHCFILKLNQKEAHVLTNLMEERAAERLLQMGPDNVIVTLGDQGAILANLDCTERFPLVPRVAVDTIDTTGAGDSFSAAILVALCREKNLHEAIEVALQIAHISTRETGARGTPRLEEVKALGLM